MTQVPASSHGGSIPSQAVTLTSAQLLDIHNTPITIVAAPAATSYIVPVRVYYTYRAGTTPYTFNGTGLTIRHQGSSVGLFLLFEQILEAATDQANYENEGQGTYFPLSSALGKALTIQDTGAAPTGGDGTLELVTEYAIITP